MAKKQKKSGGTPATDALSAAGVAFTTVEYEHHAEANDFGAEVIRQTGLDPASVFKTLVVAIGPRLLAVGVVQGSLTLAAFFLGDLFSAAQIDALTATGGVMLIGLGLRLLQIKPVPVGDLLPALVLAPVLVPLVAALT